MSSTPPARIRAIRWKPSATLADIAKAHVEAQRQGAQPATYEYPDRNNRVTYLYWERRPW